MKVWFLVTLVTPVFTLIMYLHQFHPPHLHHQVLSFPSVLPPFCPFPTILPESTRIFSVIGSNSRSIAFRPEQVFIPLPLLVIIVLNIYSIRPTSLPTILYSSTHSVTSLSISFSVLSVTNLSSPRNFYLTRKSEFLFSHFLILSFLSYHQ